MNAHVLGLNLDQNDLPIEAENLKSLVENQK
jgi:hypothetical protein